MWFLLADNSLPDRFYEGTNCRVMIQEISPPDSVDTRPAAAKRAPTPAPKKPSKASAAPSSSAPLVPAAYEKRLSDFEARMSGFEGRLTDTEQKLTTRLDEGFSQILSQLTTLQAPALLRKAPNALMRLSLPFTRGARAKIPVLPVESSFQVWPRWWPSPS